MTQVNRLFAFLLLFVGMATVLILIQGETSWEKVWDGMVSRLFYQSKKWNPLLDERLPRLIVLICTGSSLAVSGAVMQSLFQNALASPSVLGISSGGCLAAVLVFVFNLHLDYPFALPLGAFLGAFGTLFIVYGISRIQEGPSLNHLILTGVAISTLIFSIQGVILYALRDHWQLIQTISEWEAGTTNDRGWHHVHMQLPLTLVGLFGCWYYRKEMNLLALGEEEASNLGVDIKPVRWRLFLSIALLVGGALAAVGVIAFFGLVLPHVVRRWAGPDHRLLIPLCAVAGAGVLMSIDLFIRFFNLYSFSIGNFSAIIGGLFFLVLLFQPQQRLSYKGHAS